MATEQRGIGKWVEVGRHIVLDAVPAGSDAAMVGAQILLARGPAAAAAAAASGGGALCPAAASVLVVC